MIGHVSWQEELRRALERDRHAVLVVVAATRGSTPREAGAAMVVSLHGVAGTIGGGHLEYESLRIAREALAAGTAPAPWLARFPLAARLGQCCGGVATLAFAWTDADDLAWLDAAEAHREASRSCVIVAGMEGTTRSLRRMVVSEDDVSGALWDPALEAAAVAEARRRLQSPAGEAGATGLAELHGTMLLFHVVRPSSFNVLVFGNGHVGRALVQVLGALPAEVSWIDTRENDFPAQCPANVRIVATDAPADEIAPAPPGAYVVVMTHSHAQDYDIVEAALARDDWRYLGLIGSRSKRAQFERRFLARGRPREALDRLSCPIGSERLKSKEPGVIAVAVTAQILEIRQAHDMAPESR